LQKYHWKALITIVGGFPDNDLNKQLQEIAKKANITIDQLLDELNELALESISDVLIDVSKESIQIEEDYTSSVETVLSWIENSKKFV
jgi:hypothetical protein